ncbi:hypothetical protein EP331_15530 [bacterium]|nr:MAG: hypothetical protein EP331_15530 [bacterium]
MKILYGIQGTGHGHVSRAREILPALMENYDVDILISGYNSKLHIEQPIKYRCKGISFIYGHGGISLSKSLRELNLIQYLRDTVNLNVSDYDLVISDFEPVTAWAARIKKVPSLSMSHQSAFASDKTPRPDKVSRIAEMVMKHYAPCDQSIAFHFEQYDDFIMPPIIREEVRRLKPYVGNHVTVYLPAFSEQLLIDVFGKLKQREWHIFSPSITERKRIGNMILIPVNNQEFLSSLEGSEGLITSAGFEACAEAMYLGKKLLTIPIQHQYEQYCNAAALKKMGITVIPKISNTMIEKINAWVEYDEMIPLPNYSTAHDVIAKMKQMFA